ncbi:unnamed protein product [Scytosiphon promiscuus]
MPCEFHTTRSAPSYPARILLVKFLSRSPRPVRYTFLKPCRSTQSSINDDITITADVTEVYSGCHVDDVTFITGGNSAACGVDLTIGEEYILSLYPAVGSPFDSTDVSGLLTVGACNLARLWSSVPADEKADLAAGC